MTQELAKKLLTSQYGESIPVQVNVKGKMENFNLTFAGFNPRFEKCRKLTDVPGLPNFVRWDYELSGKVNNLETPTLTNWSEIVGKDWRLRTP